MTQQYEDCDSPETKRQEIYSFALYSGLFVFPLQRTPGSTDLLEKIKVLHLVKESPYFMKYESSLPLSQHPNTCPSREAYNISPSPPTRFNGVRLGELQILRAQ